MKEPSPPEATIVIVVDYKAGDDEAWDDLRQTLAGMARQDFREDVEILLVESPDHAARIPADFFAILPGLRVVHAEGTTSYDFKNAGVRAAGADFVILIDADCMPEPGWWRSVIEHRRAHPEAAAISGRTLYKGDGLLPRIFALLDRTYVDSGIAGPTRAISNNNAGFRRDLYLAQPLANDLGPFGSRPQADGLLAAGHPLRFEPGMVVRHGFGGWAMVDDIRRHQGFAMVRYRQLEPKARHGWIGRLGSAAIPLVVAMSVLTTWWRCLSLGRRYGLAWSEIPIAMAYAVRAHLAEVEGMRLAYRGGSIWAEDAAYR